ncbi:ABC transporter substrate-binding protein [Actinocatenispora rupis]|uniref:Sugar ABC transporter substrate-binding protein n=1 Tax=Actinocatenispora rupis TaxID=519421 RepID=A0A8J3NCU4_9ACTN|nr:sugar ABC transporter substrate-binding protein [Actinocatenispora rupis]GID10829.1 sugar ABC transporter substrate-binding protein [Actinocatenispora rupis]
MRWGKTTALVAAGALALSALAACGSGGDAKVPSDPSKVSGTVTMWIYPINQNIENTWWKSKVAAFKKKYAKVNVNVVVQPWANRDEQLTTAIAGGKGPDVVYLIPDQVPQYANTGALADVSDVVAKDKADFRPNALSAMTYQDKLYGVPMLMSVTTTIANKNLLKKAGIAAPPATWDEALADGAKLKKKGLYLTDYVATPDATLNQTFYPFLWQAGGDVLSKDGKKAAFNSPAGVKALTFLKTLVDKGYVPKDSLTVTPKPDQSVLCTSKAAMGFATSTAELSVCPGFKATDWQTASPLKETTSVGYGTVGGLSVLSGSKNAAAAKAWVQWISAPAQLKAFDVDHVYSSPRVSAGSLLSGQPLMGDTEKYLGDMKTGVTNASAPRQLMDVIKPHLQAALLGKVSVKQALADAEKDANQQLARG